MSYRDLFLVMICTVIQIQGFHGDTYATKLADKLFTNYKSYVRPYCGNDDTVTVRLDLALRQIIDLDEPTQILKLNLWIRMAWSDCQLAWNSSEYGNISSIVVPYKHIWVPDLTLYDSTSDDFPGYDDYRPNMYSDGSVYYNFPTIIEGRCIVNVRKFPYDEQVCALTFGSWAFHGHQMDLIFKNPYGDLSSVVDNVEWNITKFTAERHVLYYGCCPEPYPDVTYYLFLKRKPLFYLVNIIVPTFLITAMAILGFFLPPESGEKVSLEITVMLALAVFQLLVADSLPPSADATPLIAIYFNFCLFLVGFACIMAVIVLDLYYKGDHQLPGWAIKVFLQGLSKVTFVSVPDFNSSYSQENMARETLSDVVNKPKRINVKQIAVSPAAEDVSMADEKVVHEGQKFLLLTTAAHWRALANVIDRMSCLIFVLAGAVGTIIVFRQFK